MFFSNLRSLQQHRITLIPILILLSCRLSKTSPASSRRSLTCRWSILNAIQSFTLNLASHILMSSSPLLVTLHNLFNPMISMSLSIVLLIFDTLLTLPSEIKYIWSKKHKLGSVLYVLARYPLLALLIIDTYSNLFVIPLQVCAC